MEGSNSYRLLTLQEILFQETDADHQLSLKELQQKLEQRLLENNIDRRTIQKDLRVLEESGFEVVKNKGKYGKIFYSHQARTFELYQLRLIVDAILSAKFITINEKNKLIDQLKQLTSIHIAKTLPEPIMFSQSANLDYDLIRLNIDRIHRAVAKRRVVTYQYGKYNVEKKFVYRRNGDLYYVEPYGLVWQNDFYYLIGKFQPTNEMRHYRLDRIRNIKLTQETFKKENFHLQEYVDRTFYMFAGKEQRIKIQFKNHLAPLVIDRFGKDVYMRTIDDEHFILSTRAKLSKGLINWILTLGPSAKVLSPDDLVTQVKDRIVRMYQSYQE